tara:strand:- start:5980 stop:7020 length:1041 start_codon:yes stop_codon:yes gene_type:complete
MKQIVEGTTKLKVETPKIVSKDMQTFYNPIMKANRDLSILLLNSLSKTNMRIALPLAASGIRGIRFFKELKSNKIKSLSMNDMKPEAIKKIKENLKLNKITSKKILVNLGDANQFLYNNKCFDYIDIDPFGSPNHFLDASLKRILNNGILAVTATDTSALAGSYPTACLRKYQATPKKDHNKHESGLRILIKKCQVVAAQYDKALSPIFSYFKDHYYRIFFKVQKGKTKADKIIKQHKMFNKAGPLWSGQLWDKKLTSLMAKNNQFKELQKFLDTIKEESKINEVGTLNIHSLAEKYKLPKLPKTKLLLETIKEKKHKVAISHIDSVSLKTTIDEKQLVALIKLII